MTVKENLIISIKALDVYGVSEYIINDLLSKIEKVTENKRKCSNCGEDIIPIVIAEMCPLCKCDI